MEAGARRRSTSATTTSSARPSRGTPSGSRSSGRRSTTRATSTRAPTKGPYCVGCEEFKLPAELLDGEDGVKLCPIHERPVETALARSTTSSRCRKYADRLLELYETQPGLRRSPRARATRSISFVKQGLQDLSISPLDLRLGHPGAVGRRSTSSTCGSTRCSTTPRPPATAPTRERFDADLAGRRAPGRQGHPAVPRGDLAGDADGRRASPCRGRSSRTAGCWSAARR